MKSVIFDFDGTIADTLPVAIECAKEVIGGHIPTSKTDIERYKNMTVKELLKEFKIPLTKVPRYITLARTYIKQRVDEINIFDGLDEAIKQLKKDGYRLYIVSSNSADVISHLLGRYNLNSYFESVVGGVGVFGKTVAIKGAMKRHHLEKGQVVYIGDEVRDIKAANRLKVPIVSVTWGFNGKNILKENMPDVLVQKPSEIPSAVAELI